MGARATLRFLRSNSKATGQVRQRDVVVRSLTRMPHSRVTARLIQGFIASDSVSMHNVRSCAITGPAVLVLNAPSAPVPDAGCT